MGRQGLKKTQQTQIQLLYDGQKDLFLPCLPQKKVFTTSYRIMSYIEYVDSAFSLLINLSKELFHLVGFHRICSHYSSTII